MKKTFIDFPTELTLDIFNQVDYIDIVNLSKTCKRFHEIITNFTWHQMCILKSAVFPQNIKFSSYFFCWKNKLTDGDIVSTICGNHFKTVAVSSECINNELFHQLILTACENILVVGNIVNKFLARNFNFYLKKSNIDMTDTNAKIQEYNLKSHCQLFKNISDYDILNNFEYKTAFHCELPVEFHSGRHYMLSLIICYRERDQLIPPVIRYSFNSFINANIAYLQKKITDDYNSVKNKTDIDLTRCNINLREIREIFKSPKSNKIWQKLKLLSDKFHLTTDNLPSNDSCEVLTSNFHLRELYLDCNIDLFIFCTFRLNLKFLGELVQILEPNFTIINFRNL